MQLPALKAASFSSRHSKGGHAGSGTLADIAAFAPNLEQLFCQHLELHCRGTTSRAGSAAGVLPRCSHLGVLEVYVVDAASRAAGAAAFPAAFPGLRVFSCLPHTIKVAAEQKHQGKWSLAPAELLAQCKSVHAGECANSMADCGNMYCSCSTVQYST